MSQTSPSIPATPESSRSKSIKEKVVRSNSSDAKMRVLKHRLSQIFDQSNQPSLCVNRFEV